MQIARVVGTVVSTQKHKKFDGAKLLLVQPLNLDDTPRGAALLAVDGVGAGVHEKVLIVLEGRAAGEALGKKGAPVDAAVIGIIDTVDRLGRWVTALVSYLHPLKPRPQVLKATELLAAVERRLGAPPGVGHDRHWTP